MGNKDFFISYNQNDEKYAEWVAYILEENGYSVIIQAWDFEVGNNFVIEMERASTNAEKTILILSDNYLKSKFTQPEWAQAFAKDPMGEKGLVVPIKISDCTLNGLLATIIHLNLVDKKEKEAKELILNAVKKTNGRKKPINKPAFPTEVNPTKAH